jgi:hypothetical protein
MWTAVAVAYASGFVVVMLSTLMIVRRPGNAMSARAKLFSCILAGAVWPLLLLGLLQSLLIGVTVKALARFGVRTAD